MRSRGGDVDTMPAEAAAAFEEGLARYRRGDAVEAHAAFQRAHRRAPSDPRIMSWYGLTLVLVERNSNLGILYCEQALRASGPEPELILNMARAHLGLGQREHAVKAIARGLAAHPEDAVLERARLSIGWRQEPVLAFLDRRNPLNRWFGALRHRWLSRRHPIVPWTPMTLGLEPAPEDDSKQG